MRLVLNGGKISSSSSKFRAEGHGHLCPHAAAAISMGKWLVSTSLNGLVEVNIYKKENISSKNMQK